MIKYNESPIFIGTGDSDPYLPVELIEDSADLARNERQCKSENL